MATNIKTEIKGNLLVITVDVSDHTIKNAPLSNSGKNKLIASSQGSMALGNGIQMGLNVFCK